MDNSFKTHAILSTGMSGKSAVVDAAPIMLGYFSISVAFGILAKDYIGESAILMSIMVFAGASQFIALQLIMNKTSSALIVLTTFIVNLRHILMSSYFSPFYRHVSRTKKLLVSFGITDETFAVASKRFRQSAVSPSYHLTLNFLCYISWVGGTTAGLFSGYLIPLSVAEVLPFTLTALFIAILVMSIETRFDIYIALLSGTLAIILTPLTKGLNILIAALIACTAGGVVEKWTK